MQSALFFPLLFLSCPAADGGRNIAGAERWWQPWGTVAAWSVSAWSLTQPVNRLWSGSAMYNSIMQPFHGQETPSVLIQTPPKGQKQSEQREVFILSKCPFTLDRLCVQILKKKRRKYYKKPQVRLYGFTDRHGSGTSFGEWEQALRLTASGFGLNDHYQRTRNDKSSAAICGPNPINIMNLSTVQYVLA